ncbi:hypothetical protein [Methylopila sp. Yamaguchi]|uniref:hypothetical protein n=1 Tax=Methylopila sp. Yamaguchi TaxID=1437817 RepID=UPI000CCAA163|nr:hypothetical protein [Methylopila sp. Yamaguchi]GBD50247.1 hypothetical protein METY_3460 [Methylopila sp. Yamaguchi]
MNIDIERLRKLISDRNDMNAAARQASETLRQRRNELADARLELERHNAARHAMRSRPRDDVIERTEDRVENAVRAAVQRAARAADDVNRLSERRAHVSSIANRALEYARSLRVELPADLQEESI